jgi:peptide/nickel transport system permease protein
MGRFLLKRLLLMVPTFLGVTAITFALARAGSVEVAAWSEDPRAVAIKVGPEAPALQLYGRWLGSSLRLDFGRSTVDSRPVREKFLAALPATALLGTLALLVAYGLGVPLGIWGAVRSEKAAVRFVFAGLLALYSMPSFWVAVLALWLLATPHGVAIFPLQGWDSPAHWVLPVACLSYAALARISRHVRAAMSEALAQDYVRAAMARGVPWRRIVYRHALKNALLPALVLLGSIVPQLLGGSVIIERIFGIAGVGSLALEAVLGRDYPVVMAVTTFGALLTLVTVLAVDLGHASLDPRVRPEET